MPTETLTQAQRNDLRAIAAMIIPASDEYNVPGADDAAKTVGRTRFCQA